MGSVTVRVTDLRSQVKSLERMLAYSNFQSLEWQTAFDGYLGESLSITDIHARTQTALDMMTQAGYKRSSVSRRVDALCQYSETAELDAIDCYIGRVWYDSTSMEDIVSYFDRNRGLERCTYLLKHVTDIMMFLDDVPMTWKSMKQLTYEVPSIQESVLSRREEIYLLQKTGHLPPVFDLDTFLRVYFNEKNNPAFLNSVLHPQSCAKHPIVTRKRAREGSLRQIIEDAQAEDEEDDGLPCHCPN